MGHHLGSYLAAVYHRAARAAAAPVFHETQRAQLARVLGRARGRAEAAPLGDPLSVIYLVCRAHGRALDAQAEHVGAFCLLYLLSLDLFDDVQDDDLAGGPYAELGAALAINDAIALGFLAHDELRQALLAEADAARRAALHELSCRVSLLAVAGQHRDLLGADGALSPEQVIAMQQAKTSSLQLLCECAALLARCDDDTRARYRVLGERLAVFVQILDDLRDVYGKPLSPDLATGKVSYPLACFLERAGAAERAELATLVGELPASMPALRALFYRSGAVGDSARALEAQRRAIHGVVAAVGATVGEAPSLRTLLDIVDSLAEGVYSAPPLAATASFWRPASAWHRRVREERDAFLARMRRRGHGAPPAPSLRPWHNAHWLYVPSRDTIFYPDVDGLAEEVLPFQAYLLGTGDLTEARAAVERQLPAVIAHEMFHAWREAAGRMTDDHWHEEWAANRLAVAYAREHAPETLAHTDALCRRVVTRFADRLDDRAEAVLARCSAAGGHAGYGMDLLGTAVVTLEMVRRLIGEAPALGDAMRELLTPALRRSA